jgi:hypothetical protein
MTGRSQSPNKKSPDTGTRMPTYGPTTSAKGGILTASTSTIPSCPIASLTRCSLPRYSLAPGGEQCTDESTCAGIW